MAKYLIDAEVCMGCNCMGGGVYSDGSALIEISDEEVAQVVALMQQHNSSNVETIGLAEAMPELYKRLDEAYHDVAYRANALHWLDTALFEGEFDEMGLIEYCEQNCGYEYTKPSDEEDIEEEEETDDEDEDEDEDDEEYDEYDDEYEDELDDDKREDFHAWLAVYLERADLSTLHTIYLDYLGFDDCVFEMEEDAYSVVVPQEIIEKANLTK